MRERDERVEAAAAGSGRERAAPSARTVARIAASVGWVLVAGLVGATLVPIGLRPHTPGSFVGMERGGAFAVTALCLAIGHPRRLPVVLAGLVLLAGVLEFAQTLTSSRHGRLPDALVKAAGAIVGIGAALFVRRVVNDRCRDP